MKTLITGVPGAGKTLYALEKLVLPLVGTTIKHRTDDGVEVEIPRRIFTNIKGLQVDHELVEAGPAWVQVKRGSELVWEQPEGNRKGFHNWHEWAPPGAVIVVDEFQKIWPPRANGAPVPPDVQAMDTHRHMGVDFIEITQNANNVDRHITALVGRHLHVRRIANLPMAIVYEWDHCSRSLLFSKAISKSPWRYDRKVFKLYHSADLHTKQPRKVPPLVWVVLGALVLASWKIPETYATITGKADAHKAVMAKHEPGKAAVPAAAASVAAIPASGPVPVSNVAPPLARSEAGPLNGCIKVRERCACFDSSGVRVQAEPSVCEAHFDSPAPPADVAATVFNGERQAPPELRDGDADILAFMSRRRGDGAVR